MAFKKLGTSLSRALWNNGSRTPPPARSKKSNCVFTICDEYSGFQRAEEKKCEGCESGSCRSDPAVLSPSAPSAPAVHSLKRPEEPVAVLGRSYSSTALKVDHKTYLWARYNEMKRLVHGE